MKQIVIIFFLSVLVFMPEFSQASESKLVTKMQIQKANVLEVFLGGKRKKADGRERDYFLLPEIQIVFLLRMEVLRPTFLMG